MAKEKEVGKVVHYFDKIKVVVILLSSTIKSGDTLKFVKGENEFEQTVDSMQIEHDDVKKAKKGNEVAIRVDEPVKSGAWVYKV